MGQQKKEKLTPQIVAKDLANFAIDRSDLKEFLAAIPEDNSLDLVTIEYELQILKILSVGWAISFYMPETNKNKVLISGMFWEYIQGISKNISTLTETTAGKQINYFEIIKERLDTYLKVIQKNPEISQNPADIIGPAFAVTCNCPNDPIAILTSTKMFTLTLGSVKEYLNAVEVDDIKLN
ncbi:MAG: hypothetical protein GY699_11875 [Desulfobacteraceae bacterium]|nr:hypothetical protein [Desulfobacteraceae bacterium]